VHGRHVPMNMLVEDHSVGDRVKLLNDSFRAVVVGLKILCVFLPRGVDAKLSLRKYVDDECCVLIMEGIVHVPL
jgi:hypothetical protein